MLKYICRSVIFPRLNKRLYKLEAKLDRYNADLINAATDEEKQIIETKITKLEGGVEELTLIVEWLSS